MIKQILVSVLVLIIAMIVFSYFFGDPRTKAKIDYQIGKVAGTIKTPYEEFKHKSEVSGEDYKSCIVLAESLVPSTLWLSEISSSEWFLMMVEDNSWKDNTSMRNPEYDNRPVSYTKGKGVGENENHFYSRADMFDNLVEYSARIIDGEGVILGYNSFKVDFRELNLIQDEMSGARFEVLNFTIFDCKKVS